MRRADRTLDRHVVVPFLTLLLAACDAGNARNDGVVVRDSAGVTIVENERPVRAGGDWITVETDPIVRIGTVDGPVEQQLLRVRDATRLPDGRIVLLNSGTSDVRFYDAQGRHIRTVGRAGAGPGEFQSPRWLAVRADTLVVFDPFQENGRLTYLDLEGDYLGDHRPVVPGVAYPSPDAMLPDGSLLDELSQGSVGPTELGHVRFTRAPVRYARTGESLDTIAVVAGGETFRAQLGAGIAQRDVPFGLRAQTARAGDRLYLGNGDGFRVDAYSLDGERLLSIRARHEPMTVTPALKQRWIDATLSDPIYQARPDAAQTAREMYVAAPLRETARAYSSLRADASGRLWVQRYTPPWEVANAWSVFDRDGRWLGDVDLPPGLAVLEIGTDYVLGVRTDEMDVEYVVVYRVRGARPEPPYHGTGSRP